jgi:hypothetical protein
MLSPENSVFLGDMNFLSPDGRSFSFDERANGYARGEGVLAVVIKPLADALNNGDVIRAVVRSTASNHGGRTPILTQPSAEAQEALIRDAYRKAGLGFEHTRYVEAHGSCKLRSLPTDHDEWCADMAPVVLQGQELYVAGKSSRLPDTTILEPRVYRVDANKIHSQSGTQSRCRRLEVSSARADPHKSPFLCKSASKCLRECPH